MQKTQTFWPGQKAPSGSQHALAQPAVTLADVASSKVLHAFGDEITVLLAGANTGGKLAMWYSITPPQGGPPPHIHQNEDEWFFVLEGTADFLVDGAWQSASAGTAVFVPRGTVHTFRNSSDEPLKMLTQITPAGLDTFFARCAVEFARPGAPDMARIMAISAEHGIEFVTP